eukprot:CAMPEP_0183363726 /NCGR_PEP_ID=MMETSP0164_2-20130417/76551_1 /TAXON_ID=221442 /ORGANISM="Coccolithus pelagicus ssp braarudi, Strain PLY182g" /LENGTH=281 /DNA_ID=CAMNT_0025538883 /DNA_START=1 /DNA_END=846 /DNA_ORIENTATION=-
MDALQLSLVVILAVVAVFFATPPLAAECVGIACAIVTQRVLAAALSPSGRDLLSGSLAITTTLLHVCAPLVVDGIPVQLSILDHISTAAVRASLTIFLSHNCGGVLPTLSLSTVAVAFGTDLMSTLAAPAHEILLLSMPYVVGLAIGIDPLDRDNTPSCSTCHDDGVDASAPPPQDLVDLSNMNGVPDDLLRPMLADFYLQNRGQSSASDELDALEAKLRAGQEVAKLVHEIKGNAVICGAKQLAIDLQQLLAIDKKVERIPQLRRTLDATIHQLRVQGLL